MMTASEALVLSGRIVGIGIAISSAEVLTRWRDYQPAGMLDGQTRFDGWAQHAPRMRHHFRWLFAPAMTYVSAALSLAGGVTLAVGGPAEIRALAAFVSLVSIGLLSGRGAAVPLGSDQMAKVVCTGVLAGALRPHSDFVLGVGVFYIAAQACLAYAGPGSLKLTSPVWRSGVAPALVLTNTGLGPCELGFWLQRHRAVSRLAAWSVIVLECGFPLSVFGPAWLTAALLVAATAMHVVLAFTTGLNLFVWSFLATYPSIFVANAIWRSWL